MEQIVFPGLPAETAAILTVVIGYISGLLVGPLTAIWKKLGRTEGVTTVGVSAALSLMVGLGWAVVGVFVSGEVSAAGLGRALVVTVIAFVRANGAYLMQVQANAKANRTAPPPLPIPATTPEVTVKVATPAAPVPQAPPTVAPGIVEGQPLPEEYLVGPTPKKATLRVED